MPLTEVQIRKLQPREKPFKVFDGGGLYLLVPPNGAPLWRLKYRFDGKEKLLSLGTFKDVSLKQARAKRDQARALLSTGTDPSGVRKAEAAIRTEQVLVRQRGEAGLPPPGSFEAVARDWHQRMHCAKVSEGHAERTMIRFEQDVFPWIGRMQLIEVTAPKLLEVLRRVERRGAIETTHRIKDSCGQVFRYGVACGFCERDPSRDLRDALPPVRSKHLAATTDPAKVGELLRAIDGYTGLPVTRAALALAPLLFQRPGNLRMMEWTEVNLGTGEWIIPAAKMKRTIHDKLTGVDHFVPLSRQAISILADLQPLTGDRKYVFPSVRGNARPMSEVTLNAALQRLGFNTKTEMTTHGFRAMARTLLAERLDVPEAVIEAQLAHAVRDSLGRAYNRTTFAEQRREMMQTWADYLDALRQGDRPASEDVRPSLRHRDRQRATLTRAARSP